MNLYQSTVDYLMTLPILQSWPEFRAILVRMAEIEPRDWQLPLKACEAVGGSAEQALPAVAAIACAQIGIILIDDLLDDDPRGEYRQVGPALAANFASSFQAAALEALFPGPSQPTTRLSALHSLNRMILTLSFGQYLDVRTPADEVDYWQIVQTKSGPFFGAAFRLGALLGGAPENVAGGLERFGQLYGEMIQIHDDLNDTMAVPANADWVQKRSPLPILFARLVDHPARPKFIELYQDISQPGALQEAQNILIHCGAISYCVNQLIRRHQVMQETLNVISLVHRSAVAELSEGVIAPVWKLFEGLGDAGATPARRVVRT